MNPFIVILVLLILVLAGCAGVVQFGDKPPDPRSNQYYESLSDIPSDSLRESRRMLLEFIQIADDTLYRKLERLDANTEWPVINSLVQAFYGKMDAQYNPETPDTNEWWGEMQRRIDYCEQRYNVRGMLGRHWDPRALAVILLGPPDSEDDFSGPCVKLGGSEKQCIIYRQTWTSPYLQLAYQSDASSTHPDQSITWVEPGSSGRVSSEEIFRTAAVIQSRIRSLEKPEFTNQYGKEIKFFSELLSFPNPDGSVELYAVIGIDLDEFKKVDSTIMFHAELYCYTTGDNPKLVDSARTSLMSIPASVRKIKDAKIPIHFGMRLKPGMYKATVAVFQDSTDAKGIKSGKLAVPSQRASNGFSDLLLVNYFDETQKNRVQRHGLSIAGDLRREFARGDTIVPYAEIICPDTSRYHIKVVLHHNPAILGDRYKPVSRIIYEGETIQTPRVIQFTNPMVIPSDFPKGNCTIGLFLYDDEKQAEWGYAWAEFKIN